MGLILSTPDPHLRNDKINELLAMTTFDANCLGAVLYAQGIINPVTYIEGPDFIRLLDQYTVLVQNPEPGDIVCIKYNSGTEMVIQHAFIMVDQIHVFHKWGPDKFHKYEIVSLEQCLSLYCPKVAGFLRLTNKSTVAGFVEFDQRVKCYRRI